jgi:hypothetical protein
MADRYQYPHTVEIDTDGDGRADRAVKQYVTMEFSPDAAGTTWVSTTGREMFSHLRPAALQALDGRFDQKACSSSRLGSWVHKYTEYCGDAKHAVSTVFCNGATVLGDASEQLPSKVVHSAVFLIDVTEPANPRYTNLTAAVEAHLASQGRPEALMGAFGTCGHL